MPVSISCRQSDSRFASVCLLTFLSQVTIVVHVACTYRAIHFGYGKPLAAIDPEYRPVLEKVRKPKIPSPNLLLCPRLIRQLVAALQHQLPVRAGTGALPRFSIALHLPHGPIRPADTTCPSNSCDFGGMDCSFGPCDRHPWRYQSPVVHTRWNSTIGTGTLFYSVIENFG